MDTPLVPVKSRSIRLSYPCAVVATILIVGGAPPASSGLTGCAAPPPRSPVPEASSALPALAASSPSPSGSGSGALAAASTTPPGVAVAPAPAPEPSHTPVSEEPPPAPSTPPHVWKGGEFQRALTQLARWVKRSGGSLSAEMSDVASGAVLGSHAPSNPENPASNQKILTTAAVLHNFGADHRFRTWLCGTRNGASLPRLVLRGSGDPSLSSSDLQLMAKTLAKAGIHQVADVLVDQSFFDSAFVPPAFEQQPDEWAAFRAPVSAVSLNRNVTTLNVKPTEEGQPASVWFDPPGFVDVTGTVRTEAKERSQNVKLTLKEAGTRLAALVAGSISPNSPAFHWSRRASDPRLLAGYGLQAALVAEGIQVSGKLAMGGEDERTELVVHDSKPLAELLPELGKDSDNFYAETLLKDLGARVKGAPASSENGAAAVLDYLREIEALDSGTRITNGSGLFDANRVTAHTLVSTLRSAYRDPKMSRVFVEQLAIGGVDGTLKHRFAAFKKTHAIRAKTGTLDQVIALSGYVFRPDGSSPVAFALIVSGIAGKHSEVRKRVDDVIVNVARELARDVAPD